MKGKDEYTKTLQTICKLGMKGKINQALKKKEKKKKEKKKRKTASSPVQDLHPDWDRFRGTMLSPLSCGELAMYGEQILSLYVTSCVHTAKNKSVKIL